MADSLGGAEETKILGPEPADAPKDERRLRIAQLAGARVTQRLWRHKAVGSMDADRERKTSEQSQLVRPGARIRDARQVTTTVGAPLVRTVKMRP